MAKAEKEFLRQRRLEAGHTLSDEDLDPKYAASKLPNREVGARLKSQLFALSKEPELCCIGLFRYLDLSSVTVFSIDKAVAAIATSSDLPLQTKLPVSYFRKVTWAVLGKIWKNFRT